MRPHNSHLHDKRRPASSAPGRCGRSTTNYVVLAVVSHPTYQSCSRRNTSDALVPPNPNEFDKTTSISRSRALCGTKSTNALTDGLSRLSVGGATRSRMARIEKIASTAPAAPNRWPIEDLVEDMEMQPASSPTSLCTALSSISSPTGVDVP